MMSQNDAVTASAAGHAEAATHAVTAPCGIRSKPTVAYVICASQRSGSNLLCEALGGTEILGQPHEYFLYWEMEAHDRQRLEDESARPWLIPVDVYLQKLTALGTTSNGVFGVKIMWSYFGIVLKKLRTLPSFQDLSFDEIARSLWGDVRYIHMTRRDKVRQAVSMAKAIQSGRWIDVDREVFAATRAPFFYTQNLRMLKNHVEMTDRDLQYDFDQIARLYRMVCEEDESWSHYLRATGADVFRVVYEEFVEQYETTTNDLIDFLQVTRPQQLRPVRGFMKRQSDSVNDEWVDRFRQDLTTRGDDRNRE
jgi:LPS sulfotransferase NodH